LILHKNGLKNVSTLGEHYTRAYPNQKKGTFYPLFSGLVKQVAERSATTISREEKRLLKQGFADRVLGEWRDRRIEVHDIAGAILRENENEHRVKLHEAIITLFPKHSRPMIVTTNLDDLLVITLKTKGLEEESDWEIYEAPTLPPVKRFSGICFLHGRVTNPQEMILTDRDIGRAYMEEGWALKFAHDLFKEYKVLFIGYSLQDPPLRYLSLALETTKDRNRWAFIPEPKDARRRENLQWDWERRGVVPIWVPVKRGNHTALEKCIAAWSKDNRRGFIDKKNLLYDWGLSDPTYLLPYQLDRARYFLSISPELLRDFVGAHLNTNWFDKLIEWGHLDFLLKSSGGFKEADYKLAQLLSHWIIENPMGWLVKLSTYRDTINPLLFDTFLREFNKDGDAGIDINDLRKLIEFFTLIMERGHIGRYWLGLDKVLQNLLQSGFIEDAIWLFIKSIKTNIRVEVKPNFSYMYAEMQGEDTTNIPPNIVEFEYPPMANSLLHYHAREYINKIFMPNIIEVGYLLLKAITHHFYNTRLAIKRGGGGKYSYIRRRAIERNESSDHGDNFFINSLRDLWEALLHVRPDKASMIYEIWKEIDDSIFQRLSLHSLRKLVESGYVK
jgi:hypothetical protein